MKRSTLLISILIVSLVGCVTQMIPREPQQVGGDVGMRHINVEDLSAQNAGSGMKIVFQGQDAENFYNSLPTSLLRDDPEEAVGFVARGKTDSMLIRCVRKRYDGVSGEYLRIGGGPLCTLSIEKTKSIMNLKENKWIFPVQE